MKRNISILVILAFLGCHTSLLNASTIYFPSMEVHLDGDWLELTSEELIAKFGENIISMEVDEEGNVLSCVVDGEPYVDFTSGIENQSGHMDAGFLGAFELSESEGQGYVEHETMDPDEVGDVESIPGVPELSPEARDALNKIIK